MVRENMRSPRAELHFTLVSQETSGVSFLGSTPGLRLGIRPYVWCMGGLAQMAERSLRMRQARGSMPLSSTPCALHMNSNLRFQAWLAQSVERTTLTIFDVLANAVGCCDRVVAGSIPASGARSFVEWLWVQFQQSAEKEFPADPGSSPGEGDNKYTATTVPRSLGGQDSRFSLSQLCVAHAMHTLIFFARKQTYWASLFTGFDSQLATHRLCSYGLVGHNVRLTRGRSRVRTPV